MKKDKLSKVLNPAFNLYLNAIGTAMWSDLYYSGRVAEWWVIPLIILCGLTALAQLPKIFKAVK